MIRQVTFGFLISMMSSCYTNGDKCITISVSYYTIGDNLIQVSGVITLSVNITLSVVTPLKLPLSCEVVQKGGHWAPDL